MPLADCRSVFPAKSYQDAWRNGSWVARGQVNMLDEAKLNQNFSLFNCRSIGCVMWLSIVMEKNWALSVDLYWQLALQFWVHLIDLLSILLKYNGFTRIQKAVVDQMGNRLPNSDHDFFFWHRFSFGKCFGASFWSNHWVGCHQLLCKIHFSLHITIQLRNDFLLLCRLREDDASKQRSFDFLSAHEAPIYQAFYLSNLLQMSNDHQTVNVGFLGNFLCRCKRISFSYCSFVNFWSPSALLLIFKALFYLLKRIEPPCTVCLWAIPGPNASLMMQVVFAALWPILNSN